MKSLTATAAAAAALPAPAKILAKNCIINYSKSLDHRLSQLAIIESIIYDKMVLCGLERP